jgi:hypothetical protein
MTATDHGPFQYFTIRRLRFTQIAGTSVPPVSTKHFVVFKEMKAGRGLCRFFVFGGLKTVESDVISCKGTIENNKYMYCIK